MYKTTKKKLKEPINYVYLIQHALNFQLEPLCFIKQNTFTMLEL